MVGGAHLARIMAAELGIDYVFAERVLPVSPSGLFPVKYRVPETFRAALAGKAVALVDDAISAGSAIRGSHADLLACGARPVVIGALFIFGGNADAFAASHGLAIEAIARMSFNAWPPRECPLCAAGAPLESVSD